MKKYLFLFSLGTMVILTICTSCLPESPILEMSRRKTAVVCKDSVRIIWNENLLIETSWLTGNPCYDHNGVAYYIYK